MPKYKWQAPNESPIKRLQKLNQHREQMLERASSPTGNILEETINEWNILLEERDKTLRKVIDEENKIIFKRHMEELINLLQIIGKLDYKDSPASLQLALVFLHQEVKSYLSASGIIAGSHVPKSTSKSMLDPEVSSTPNNTCSDNKNCKNEITCHCVCKTVKQSSASIQPRRRGYFTPTESPLCAQENNSSQNKTAVKYYKKTPTGVSSFYQQKSLSDHSEESHKQNRAHTSKVPRYFLRTGSSSGMEEDLRCSLLKGKENLRSTPGISRSPGGTPQKSARSFNLSDAGDFVAVALKKKFLNIRKLYGSPQNFNDDSRDEDTNLSVEQL